MHTAKNLKLILIPVFLLSFILRLAAILILRFNINPSVWEYDSIALNILAKRAISTTIFQLPTCFSGIRCSLILAP